MCNQDDVALKLRQVPIMEMHELMFVFGGKMDASWARLIEFNRTEEFLLSHGWTINAYIDECVLLHRSNSPSYIAQVMCRDFIAGIKDYQ